MGDILPFAKAKPGLKPGNSLCKSGFHRWKAVANTPFDVKQGQLVTRYRCERCGHEKVEGVKK
jgi:hypothetical protein